jgi:hypothetical protein
MGLPCHECAGLIGHGANLTVNAPVTVTAPAVRPIPLSCSQPIAKSQIFALSRGTLDHSLALNWRANYQLTLRVFSYFRAL